MQRSAAMLLRIKTKPAMTIGSIPTQLCNTAIIICLSNRILVLVVILTKSTSKKSITTHPIQLCRLILGKGAHTQPITETITCTLLSPVIRAIKPKISVKPIPCRARATSMNLVRRAVRVCSDAILVRHRPTHWLRTWCLQAGRRRRQRGDNQTHSR